MIIVCNWLKFGTVNLYIMANASYYEIPDTDDPFEDLIVFLSLFELYKFNYIEFAFNLNKYYRRLITKIDENKVNLSETQYIKYEQLHINKLNTLEVPKFPNTKKLVTALDSYDDWTKIENYKLELFLFFDSNETIYKDLNLNFITAGEMRSELGDKIMNLQTLFYQAAFNLSITQIKAHLNKQIILKTENEYFSDIFKKEIYFNIFKDYIDNHLVDPYGDISFIFQKLKTLDYIHQMNHIPFVMWLRDNEFIKSTVADDIIEKGMLKSFSKSASKKREKTFENLSEKYLP